MAWLMTAPSRVMRWPSQAGTRPPWSGRSALPARRTIRCLLPGSRLPLYAYRNFSAWRFMLRPVLSWSEAVTRAAMERGLSANITQSGGAGGVMRIAPPLTAGDTEIDLGIELLDTAIARAVAR